MLLNETATATNRRGGRTEKRSVRRTRQVEGRLASVPVFSRNGIFFWCFGFIVRLRYTFLIIAVILAAYHHRDVVGVLVWLAASTFGVLLHELGHAGFARYYGAQPVIELNSLGGLTSWTWLRPPRWSQEIVCSLAGPGIGLAFGLILTLLMPYSSKLVPYPWISLLLGDVRWVTVGWSLFNLLPILPLDGAAAMEVGLARRTGAARARYVMRVASVATGIAAAILSFASGMSWAGALAALFAYNNAQAIRGLPGVQIKG